MEDLDEWAAVSLLQIYYTYHPPPKPPEGNPALKHHLMDFLKGLTKDDQSLDPHKFVRQSLLKQKVLE